MPDQPAHPDSQAALKAAVAAGNIPTLLLVLVQMTGDLAWLDEPYRPTRNRGLGDNSTGGLDPVVQNQVRAAAVKALTAWLAGAPVAIPEPPPELLVRMLGVSMGEPVPLDYADMLAHELGLDDGPQAPAPTGGARTGSAPARTSPSGFRAIVIGAGASGLCAGVRLGQAGIPYTVLERNTDVGGVWHENRYPGAGVDTPSHLYSFSFAPNDWTRWFAAQHEIRAYFERVADEFGVRANTRFGVEVTAATWDEDAQEWVVTTRTAGGTETLRCSVLVSAVGAFNKPRIPDIEGMDDFRGPVAHTARWPEGLDLTDQRVAVVGNGASAMQLVPAVADRARSVTVFQRSPQWAAPFEQFQEEVPPALHWLYREVPLYEAWYRLRLAWTFNDRIHGALQKDPGWAHPERSISAVNDGHRRAFTRHIVEQLGDRQDLLPAVLPTYPPFGKRMLLDNGWFRTVTRDDVELVTDRVVRLEPDRVVTASGKHYEADVVVLATGFDVVRFLAPMTVTGRDGRVLHDEWDDDDARAYLGLTVPGFPNFFCLYGPNTQFGHGGSLLFMIELQMHYLSDLLRQMTDGGLGAVECRQDVHDDYNAAVDAAHNQMVWTHPGMDVYYRNSRGRVVVINPFRIVDFWHRLRHADLEEYRVDIVTSASRVTA